MGQIFNAGKKEFGCVQRDPVYITAPPSFLTKGIVKGSTTGDGEEDDGEDEDEEGATSPTDDSQGAASQGEVTQGDATKVKTS